MNFPKKKERTMKYFLLLLFLPLTAFADLSGTATLSDDYHFRGISQNAGDLALSAEVTANVGALFGSVWASQIDGFDTEWDLTVGVSKNFGKANVTVAYIDYNYANFDGLFSESPADVEEVMISASYRGFGVSHFVGLDQAADYTAVHYNGVLDLHYGQHEDAHDWHIGKTVDVNGFDVSFGYKMYKGDFEEKGPTLSISKSF
jgi:hypothetical protein